MSRLITISSTLDPHKQNILRQAQADKSIVVASFGCFHSGKRCWFLRFRLWDEQNGTRIVNITDDTLFKILKPWHKHFTAPNPARAFGFRGFETVPREQQPTYQDITYPIQGDDHG